ncbi:MAG: hypothetical protein HY744_08775 [Deltaproteobacteria bacterium]|nr:hypothetical protein [Deltaproteobacteria bacterium]
MHIAQVTKTLPLALLLALASGCYFVKTSDPVTASQVIERRSLPTERTAVRKPKMEVSALDEGIQVELRSYAVCLEREQVTTEHETRTKQELKGDPIWGYLIGGSIFASGVAGGALSESGGAKAAWIALVAVPAAAYLAHIVIGQVRAIDEVESDTRTDIEKTETLCQPTPLAGKRVVARFSAGLSVEGNTDASGRVTMAFPTVGQLAAERVAGRSIPSRAVVACDRLEQEIRLEAHGRYASLVERAEMQAEEEAYERATKEGTLPALRGFQSAYAGSKRAEALNGRIEELLRERLSTWERDHRPEAHRLRTTATALDGRRKAQREAFDGLIKGELRPGDDPARRRWLAGAEALRRDLSQFAAQLCGLADKGVERVFGYPEAVAGCEPARALDSEIGGEISRIDADIAAAARLASLRQPVSATAQATAPVPHELVDLVRLVAQGPDEDRRRQIFDALDKRPTSDVQAIFPLLRHLPLAMLPAAVRCTGALYFGSIDSRGDRTFLEFVEAQAEEQEAKGDLLAAVLIHSGGHLILRSLWEAFEANPPAPVPYSGNPAMDRIASALNAARESMRRIPSQLAPHAVRLKALVEKVPEPQAKRARAMALAAIGAL